MSWQRAKPAELKKGLYASINCANIYRDLRDCVRIVVIVTNRKAQVPPGLTDRDVLDKLSAIMMIDVRIPTTDGRILEMRRHSQPELEQRIILDKLKMNLPKQPPPKVYSHQLNGKLCGGN